MRVLILGGYGTFGGRLAHLLADAESLTLLIAGRSAAKAAEFCAGFRGRARAVPLSFDRNGDVEAQLRQSHPHLIVDASGPFQSYGEDRYRLVKAALAAGVDYIDLADGSEFVKGIRRFDRDGRDQIAAAWPYTTNFDLRLLACPDCGAQFNRHVRREMNLGTVGQDHPVGIAVRVDQESLERAGDFGEVIRIEPVHVISPLRVAGGGG